MNFFFHADKINLSRDIERYRILSDLLGGGEDLLAEYDFNIASKDKFLEDEE